MPRNILNLFWVIIIFASCNAGSDNIKEPANKLVNGEHYFKSEKTEKPEYLYMKLLNGKVEGAIYRDEEVAGKVYYSFKGDIFDTLMKVQVHITAYEKVDACEEWAIHWEKDRMGIQHILGHEGIIYYTILPSNQMPDTSEYASVEAVSEDNVAEYLENIPSVWYESTSPNAMKRTIVFDYIKIYFDDKKVFGKGAGMCEGSPFWSMSLEGNLVKENTLQVKVTYTEVGSVPFTATETWTVDPKKEHLYRSDCAALKNLMGEKEYHTTESDKIPKDFMERIRK